MRATLSEVLKTLKKENPRISFHLGEVFQWDPASSCLFYNPNVRDALALLLHEVSHAQLRHVSFSRDIELIRMERAAWDYATLILAKQFSIPIPINVIEDSLDTYRDWLHKRSSCPSCHATGIQIDNTTYKCLACGSLWNVNEARSCQLRRYISKKAR